LGLAKSNRYPAGALLHLGNQWSRRGGRRRFRACGSDLGVQASIPLCGVRNSPGKGSQHPESLGSAAAKVGQASCMHLSSNDLLLNEIVSQKRFDKPLRLEDIPAVKNNDPDAIN
jgi:hypothetical protein